MAGDFAARRALGQESIRLNEDLGEPRFAEFERRLIGEDTTSLAPYLTFDEASVAALDHDVEREAL